MGTKTITETITLIPSGNTGITNMSASSSYPATRAYADETNTSYARFTVTQSTTGYIYYTFPAANIPSGATITSVTGKAKAYVSNTTRVSNTRCQLYVGTTAKGDNVTFASTTATTVNLSPGNTWSVSDLNNLRLYIGGTASSSSSSRYIYFYGASITITYTVTVTTYDISVTNNSSATVVVSDDEPVAGETVTVTASTLSGITVTDNSTNVTSQFVEVRSETDTMIPNGNSGNSNFTVSNIENAYTGSDSTTYAQLQLAGSTTGSIYLDMSNLDIPSGAAIQSISCSFTYQFNNNNSTSGFTASCQMYANTTAKGSSYSMVSSGSAVAKTTVNLTLGTWTASELTNARLYITATNSASRTVRYLYIYGVSFSVTYEAGDAVYVYTISNVSGNHTIVFSGSAVQDKIYFKNNGSWVAVTKVYKKVSGSWVEQTNLTNVFSSGTNYLKG